jgi:hypothetical protein
LLIVAINTYYLNPSLWNYRFVNVKDLFLNRFTFTLYENLKTMTGAKFQSRKTTNLIFILMKGHASLNCDRRKKICNNFKTFGNGESMKTSNLPFFNVVAYLWKYKIRTWLAEHSMMRQQHVNKEKLNKSILNASVDTVLCLTLLCVEGSNVLETVIGPTILAIVLFYYLKRLSLLTPFNHFNLVNHKN